MHRVFLFVDVLGDGLDHGLAGPADQLVTFASGPVVRCAGRFELTFEVRNHLARHQVIAAVRRLGRCPVMAEHQQGAEAAGAVEQVFDVGDGVLGRADAAIPLGRVVRDELVWGLGAFHAVGQRDEIPAAPK